MPLATTGELVTRAAGARRVVVARGLDPDRPRHLTRLVTLAP
ncbi:hypothetical protein ACIBW9_10240 [Streptomyces sp. NPDC049541]